MNTTTTKNKSKPIALIATVLLLSADIGYAQTMNIKQSNGTQTAYALNSVRKLTFASGNVTLQKTDNTTATFALSSLKYVNFSGTTSIEEQILHATIFNLNTYPNPVSDVLNIEVINTDTKNATISILSIEGKVLLTEQANGQKKISLNLSQLPQGLYLCQYKTEKELKTTKLIKQ